MPIFAAADPGREELVGFEGRQKSRVMLINGFLLCKSIEPLMGFTKSACRDISRLYTSINFHVNNCSVL